MNLTKPTEPQDKVADNLMRALEDGLNDLAEKQQDFNNYQRELANLKAMVSAKPKLGVYQGLIEQHSLVELEDILQQAAKNKRIVSKYRRLTDEIQLLPEPKLTQEEIQEGISELEAYRNWVEYQKLLNSEHVDCPKCRGTFPYLL